MNNFTRMSNRVTIGLIFPGQGSQQIGMGKDFVDNHAIARETFEEAADALGFDLWKICSEGPEEDLTLTFNAQAAILTVSTIAYRILAQRVELKPLSVAGHSLGEYSAIVAAGAVPFADAVKTVYQRGKFMQTATPVGVGAMAAIMGMEPDDLENLCQEEAKGEVVAPANFNSPGQIVISGHDEAVKRVLAKAKGKLLVVSAPFHSALMAPAAEKMAEVLAEVPFVQASTSVVANASNDFLTNASDFPPSLVAQITSPVRWSTGVEKMITGGVTRFIELGHGKILAGLNRRINKETTTLNVNDEATLTATISQLG